MGIEARYYTIFESAYQHLHHSYLIDDFDFDYSSEVLEKSPYQLDIYKMWSLCFLALTGQDVYDYLRQTPMEEGEPIEGLPQQVVFGKELWFIEPHTAVLTLDDLQIVLAYLNELNLPARLAQLDLDDFLKTETLKTLEQIKEFFANALATRQVVIVELS